MADPAVSPLAVERGGRAWRLLLGVYCLSGVTGVAYEVLWVRMLATQFGASNFGVVVTLFAFMGGLGAGGFAGARLIHRFRSPLRTFAALEGTVAAVALLMPWLFGSLDGVLAATAGDVSLPVWFGLQASMSFAILFIPAFALGLAFPLMLRCFEGSRVTVVSVYGLNTLGGAIGALLPLALLPLLGWVGAIRTVAALGLLIAATALLISSRAERRDAGEPPVVSVAGSRPPWRSLLCYGGIGAAALMLQVGWTRLFGMILLRTEYVLAIILFVFLAGLGLGSLLSKRIPPAPALTWFPVSAGVFALLGLWGLPRLAHWADYAEFDSLGAALSVQGIAIAGLTLPATLILGAWLPLLSRSLAPEADRMAGAWLYGANCLGAALGALAAGFVLIPLIGTAATLCLAALMLFAFGMAWSASARPWIAAPLLLALAWPAGTLPEASRLLPRAHGDSRDLLVHEDALSITHVLEQADGQRLLLSDLRWMDASSEHTAVEVQKNQARLPLLLHPAPREVLFLGLGTGITAAGALPFPDLSVTGVELSAGAIFAAREFFTPVNEGVMDRIDIVHDDVKRFLRARRHAYDVIVGDLFHPDLVGRSNLLSVQQFRRVRGRLAEGGVFVQWIALNQFDRRSLETVLRGFAGVFPEASLFMDGFRLALVGWAGGQPAAAEALANLARLSPEQQQAATGGEGAWTWLGRYMGRITVADGPVEDEWSPRIEFSLPRARFAEGFQVGTLIEGLLAVRPGVEQASEALDVPPEAREQFEAAYIATELAMRAWVASFKDRPSESLRLMSLALQANPRDRWVGYDIADRMYATLDQALANGLDRRTALERILSIRPDHVAAIRDLWRLERELGEEPARAEHYRQLLERLSPLDSELRTGKAVDQTV